MHRHPELSKLVARTGVSAKHLIKRCKQVCSSWRIAPLPEKRAFTADEKRARLAYCKEAQYRAPEYWMSTVFVDEHTFYRRPQPQPCIHIQGRRMKMRRLNKDDRLKHKKYGWPKLHFLYGVHWKLGILGPYWISDCTGWPKNKHYPKKASAHLRPVDLPLAAVSGEKAGGAGV